MWTTEYVLGRYSSEQIDDKHCSKASNQISPNMSVKHRLTLRDENSRFCPPINEFDYSLNMTSNND